MSEAAVQSENTRNAQEAGSAESIPFSAEISKVLKLMIHSLYTNRDIFLRELISNASDACDKLRYEALQNDGLYGDDKALRIQLAYHKETNSVTISDNGIGMNREDLISQLGTIARSGTEEFIARLSGDAQKDVSLIGQFGVGFYSAFMVADRVTVHTCKAGEKQAWMWESTGEGSFTVTEGEARGRGTTITLYLSDDAKEYCDQFKLKHIAQTYSDHIAVPIELVTEEGKEERINEASAIWMRPKSEISKEQYQAFYKHIAHSPDEPYLILHNKAEGAMEYINLLFVPSMKPFDLYHPERRCRVKLYVKRVFITDENVEVVPAWLRFLRGVIDSEDLPLNISRETLQNNPLLGKIRDAVTNKLLAELKKKASKDAAGYQQFWDNFGAVVKEGLCESQAPKEKIFEISRFYSTHSEEAQTSLEDYVARMPEKQEAIYVINGDDLKSLRQSPQLEGFKKHGIEVLLLTDHVDDFWLNVNPTFKGKPFKSVTRAGTDLDKFAEEQPADEAGSEPEKPVESAKQKQEVADLIERMKNVLGDQVRDVRPTAKLSESPVCLAIEEGDMDIRMERFLLDHKQLPAGMPKILEINPEHPIISAMAGKLGDVSQTDEIRDYCFLLLDQAKVQEGEPIEDPAGFARRVSQLMQAKISA